ncbi:MAG: hypothetical protein SF029_25020 [bacterium]|nr:hypothetical protein [bacterium]
MRSCELNFVCAEVDAQIQPHPAAVQIRPELLPRIRQAYQADVTRFTSHGAREQKGLKQALVRAKAKELNLWRAFTKHGMQGEMYEKLAREYREEQTRITCALKASQQENRAHIANLDAALSIIAEIGERYGQQEPLLQREILRQVVSKLVVDMQERVVRLQLRTPFTYLQKLSGEPETGTGGKRRVARLAGKQKSSGASAGSSFYVSLLDPNPNQNEQFLPSLASAFMDYLELTSYPQRTALEQLLVDEH